MWEEFGGMIVYNSRENDLVWHCCSIHSFLYPAPICVNLRFLSMRSNGTCLMYGPRMV